MLAEDFLFGFGRGERPNVLHLLVAVDALHVGVIEAVAALLVLSGPENRLGGVREVAAGEVGRGIGLLPRDLVEHFHAELLHGVTDGEDDVVRAADPHCAVGLEQGLAALEPFGVEFVVEFGAAGFVPRALVHLHHLAGMAGDAAVGEKVGRIGENHVEHAVRVLGAEGVHHLEAVAVVEIDAAGVVAIGQLAGLDDPRRLGDDGLLGAEDVVKGGIYDSGAFGFPGRAVVRLRSLSYGAIQGNRPYLLFMRGFLRHALIGSIRLKGGARSFSRGSAAIPRRRDSDRTGG